MKCEIKNCSSCARYRPVLLFYADRQKYPAAPPVRAVCSLAVCAPCKDAMTVDALVLDATWLQVVRAFAGAKQAVPKREDTRLDFIRLDDPEALLVEALSNASNARNN